MGLPDEPTFRERLRLRWRGEFRSYRRLMAEILVFEAQRKALAPPAPAWEADLEHLLQQAKNCASTDTDGAWRALNAAKRMLLYSQTCVTLQSRAWALLREVEDKKEIPEWRRNSILDNLAHKDKGVIERPLRLKDPLDAGNVVDADQTLYEHFNNLYEKVHIVRKKLVWLTVAGIPALAAVIAAAGPLGLFQEISGDRAPWLTALSIALFGLLGAVVSGFTGTKGLTKTRLPFERAGWFITMGRLVLGSISAVVVAEFLCAGILKFAMPEYPAALAIGFASGFSDRILVSALSAFDK